MNAVATTAVTTAAKRELIACEATLPAATPIAAPPPTPATTAANSTIPEPTGSRLPRRASAFGGSQVTIRRAACGCAGTGSPWRYGPRLGLTV